MNATVADRLSTIPLREAHAHLAMHGQALTMLHLADCASHAECLDRIRQRAAHLHHADPTTWLLADGLRIESWPDPRWPTRDELDHASPNRPAVILSFDYHSLAANTAALRASVIAETDPDPEGGLIQRDPAGHPTGVLFESAAWKVRDSIPPLSESQREEAVLASLHHLASLGYVEVHDLLAPLWLGPLLSSLDQRGLLPLRTRVFVAMNDFDAALASAPAWSRPGRVEFAGGKVFADGTLNSRTAWMLTPYANPIPGHPFGTPLMSPAALRDAMHRTRAANLTLAIHAIGDAAVRASLDAWQAVGGSRRDTAQLRIEHAELIDRADIPRFAEMGVTCSVQPCHLLADIEVLRRELPHRLDRVLPLRDLVQAGTTPGGYLLFGSDVPIVRPDPFDSMQAAVYRRRQGEAPSEAIAPEQSLTEAEALACFQP